MFIVYWDVNVILRQGGCLSRINPKYKSKKIINNL